MADIADIVTVGLRVKDDGTTAIRDFGAAAEKSAGQTDQLEESTRKANATISEGMKRAVADARAVMQARQAAAMAAQIKTLDPFQDTSKSANDAVQSVNRLTSAIQKMRQASIAKDDQALASKISTLDPFQGNGVAVVKRLQEVSVASVGATKSLGIWSALQSEAAGHVGSHSLAIGRLERELESMASGIAGVNPAVGLLSTSLLKFGIGTIETVGILAGVAAIGYAWDKLTESARKAKEEHDKLVNSLQEGNANAALGPSPELVQQTNAQRDQLRQEQSRRRLLLNFGVSPTDDRILELDRQIKKDQGELTAGEERLTKARMDASTPLTTVEVHGRNIKEEARKAAEFAKQYAASILEAARATNDLELARAKNRLTDQRTRDDADALLAAAKNGDQAFHDQQDAIQVRNRLAEEGLTIFDAEYESRKRSLEIAIAETREAERINKARDEAVQHAKEVAKQAAEEAERPFKNMIRELQTSFTDFFFNVFTQGIKSFGDLVSAIKQMFLKMIAELLAARLMQGIAGTLGGMFGFPSMAGAQGGPGGFLGSNGWTVGGKLLGAAGFGLGLGTAAGTLTGSASGGAVAGGLSGAAAGFAVAGPIGAFVGGVTGLVSGLLSGAAAAREAAAAMRQLKKDYDAAIASFTHNDLATALAQNAAQAQSLRNTADKIWGSLDRVLKAAGSSSKQLADALAEINKQEAINADLLRKQAAEQKQYAQEDLEVRNLRATGHGSEADTLAFKEGQQREYQAALDKAMADGVIDNSEQLYLNTLATVQNNELVAFLNGTLTDALRNAPNAFRIDPYTYDFQTPRGGAPPGYPTDSGVVSQPVQGGLPTTGSSTAPPRGTPATGPVSFVFQEGAIKIDGAKAPHEVVNALVDRLDQVAAATGGGGSSRAAALELLKRRGR